MLSSKDSIATKFSLDNYADVKLRIQTYCELQAEGNSLRYDPTQHYMGIGCSDGAKTMFTVALGKVTSSIPSEQKIPTTCLRWRPQVHSKEKVLLVSDSDGGITEYFLPTHLKRWYHAQIGNSIQCLDYSPDGRQFTTAGNDRNVRVYDQQTKLLTHTLTPAQENHRGHSNRIFCVRFANENTIISGGWDAVVHIWDTRTGKSARCMLGPHVSGDAIDYQNSMILTGGHQIKDPLQLWDMGTAKLIQNLDWDGFKTDTPRVFTAKFSPLSHGSQSIAAGSSGVNEVKIFKNDGTSYKPSNKVYALRGGCYSLDFAPMSKEIGFCDASGALSTMAYDIKQ